VEATAPQTGDLVQPVRDSQARKIGGIAFGATALFLAQLYLSPAQWFPVTEPLHLALLLSGIALLALAVHRILTNKPLWMGWRSAFLGLYCGTAVLSPLWSIDRSMSVPGALEVAKHFLFFTAVVNTATSPSRIRLALLLYAGAATVPAWGTFWNWWNGELLVEGFRGRWLGVMADPNHDCMALVGAVPILLYFATNGPGLFRRLLGVGGTAVLLMGIVATHSRGGSLGLAVGVFVWVLMSKRKGLAFLLALVATAGVLLLAPPSFWRRNETISQFEEDVSVQGRLQAWQVAERIVKERPLLGVGESAFLSAWNRYSAIDAGLHPYVAHNLELEVLGQLGILGLIGMLGFVACAVISAWRARNGPMSNEARAVFASLIGYLVCQQFSGYSLSWFLYSLAAFAACIDHWGGRPARAIPDLGAGSERLFGAHEFAH
jgi:O-antigen ligase